MLNGKFFTGLPPKMMDRPPAKNRMESHFFWPDESNVQTATESNMKRRSSFQMDASPKAPPNRNNSRGGSNNEVDTRKMFHKEFANSSIQFFDNIQEENNNARKPTHVIRAGKLMKRDIAIKPNATKLVLPNSVVDEEYTLAKKKQAYTSAIRFYDYDEDDNNCGRNNVKKKPVDMNDKKELERFTKNSPKLLAKRDIRAFSSANERHAKPRNDATLSRTDDSAHRSSYPDDRKYERVREDTTGFDDSQYSPKRDNIYREDHLENTIDFCGDHEIDTCSDNIRRTASKKILKNHGRNVEYEYLDCPNGDDDLDNVEYLVRNIHMRTPKKHVTYRDEEQNMDLGQVRYYTDINNVKPRLRMGGNVAIAGSRQQKNHEPHARKATPDFDNYESGQYMETGSVTRHNSHTRQKLNNLQPKQATKMMTKNTVDLNVETTADAQKHLHSSLSFHKGEIVAVDRAPKTPTINNCRNRAATQRISVGLPD